MYNIIKVKKMKIIKIFLFAAMLVVTSCSKDKVLPEELIKERVATMTEMAELGTVEYTISKIIKANDNKAFYTIGDRKILFSCKAVVKAGIDLKDFTASNVKYNKTTNTVSVMLPSPRVLSFSVPPKDIKLEYVKVDFFRSNFSAEERNKLLRQGEADIKADIPNMGIVEEARKNAENFVKTLFGSIGVENVNVIFM